MQHILDAIQSGETSPEAFAALEVPESYRAAFVRKDEVDMFEGIASKEKDPRKSIHVDEVAMPELGPGEALVAVMASAINYNTVWTSIFEPVSTFGFLERYGRLSELTKRHDLPYHVVGSDLSGVVLATGPGVTRWKPGARVVAHERFLDPRLASRRLAIALLGFVALGRLPWHGLWGEASARTEAAVARRPAWTAAIYGRLPRLSPIGGLLVTRYSNRLAGGARAHSLAAA